MMKNSSKVLIGILMFAVIVLSASMSQAVNEITIIGGNATTTENRQNTTNTPVIVGGNTTTTNTAVNRVVNTSTSYNTVPTVNNAQATLPQTGETDIYVVAALVVVCTISAIYAYRKIRDYNID